VEGGVKDGILYTSATLDLWLRIHNWVKPASMIHHKYYNTISLATYLKTKNSEHFKDAYSELSLEIPASLMCGSITTLDVSLVITY
jgi:hypothetical protein